MPDFEQDDMNRNFIGDSSLYRQMLEKLDTRIASDEPIFDYIVTIFGHLDYPFNSSRPKVIKARAKTKCSRITPTRCITSHANSWNSWCSWERDPDSIIVMFGDHLPFLGPNFAGYTEDGLLESPATTSPIRCSVHRPEHR